MRVPLLCFLLLLLCPVLQGQDVVVLEEGFESRRLSQEVRVWITPDSTANVQEALRREAAGDFQAPPLQGLVFPYRKCSYWVAFQVENRSQFQRFFLEVSNLSLYDLRLFRKIGDSLVLIGQRGYRLDKKPRQDALFYNFEVLIAKESANQKFYLFANTGRTGTGVFLPMQFAEGDCFQAMIVQKRWMDGLLSGAGLLILVFGFGIHLANRTKASAWLLGFMLFAIFYVSIRGGVFHRICWEQIHGYTGLLIGFSASMFQTVGCFLFIHFNRVDETAPKLANFIRAFVTSGWLIFIIQSKRYFHDVDLSDGFINNIQYLYSLMPLTILLGSLWQVFQFKDKKYLVFPTVFLFQISTTYWIISLNVGYHTRWFFYHDVLMNISILIDFLIFLAWFSYELLLLKTDHARQQLALAQTRALAAENLLRGQQEERRRLRLRLHDGLSILLASARMRLSKRAADDETLRSIERDIAAAAAETRHLSHDLDPEPLREGHLLDALADSAGRAQGLSGAEISFTFDENLDEAGLPQRLKVALFYIAQELLHNALKHAEATEISLHLTFFAEKTLLLRCSDNGIGLDSAATSGGIGLENIRARVATVDGRFSMRERAGGGLVSEVEITL